MAKTIRIITGTWKRITGILLIIVLIILSACKEKPLYIVPSNAKAGDLTLEPCEIKIKSDRFNAERGILIVPESSDKTDSRLIALPIIRVKATGSQPAEPVFYFAGGPGQSNMNFKPPQELLINHDFVLIGYRGVDGSVNLDCPEVKDAIRGVGCDLLSTESLANLSEAFRKSASRLQDKGIDLNAYTMPDVISDMELARVAMHYNRINLLSQSYGTRIAQIYAYQHPEIIYRSVMIGVNPPGRFVWEPDTTDKQIEYYSSLCARDPKCSGGTAGLAQTMRHVAHNMPKRWLFFRIDPGKVKLITFALLYHRNTAAQVFNTYLAAEGGDPSGLALMSLAYDFMFPSMITWGDLVSKAASADLDKTRNYATEMDPPGSIIGAPFSKLLWSVSDWPTAPIPEEYRKVHQTDVETLLLSGNIDFATPAQFATKDLLPSLNNGKQIILKEMGHTLDIWTVQRSAIIRLLTSFYDTGVADESLIKYSPMDFHVSMGFPVLAKVGLIASIVSVAGLVFLLRFIVIRTRRLLIR